MTKIKVGINGFGRIGRLVFRAAMTRNDIEIVAINDPSELDYLVYTLKYDTVHGCFNGTIEIKDGELYVNGRHILVTSSREPEGLKWGEAGVDYVVEATGHYLTREKAEAHLRAGAKRVVMSAPAKDDTPLFVMGVNHQTYDGNAIVSSASCTTNCLAPLTKVIHEHFGIVEGLMTIENGAYTLETIWLEKGYGTPEDAIAKREKPKKNRYERQQKRHMQEKKDKEMLFLIAKILRLYQADASRAWVVKNTGNDPELTAKIYDLCGMEETSDAHRILAKLKEGI